MTDDLPKPGAMWQTFFVGDRIVSKQFGAGVVIRVSRDEKMGEWINFRVDADGKIQAQHQRFLEHQKGDPE